MNAIRTLLSQLFQQQASPESQEWLQNKLQQVETATNNRSFYMAFSSAPRFLGKAPLELDKTLRQSIAAVRSGLDLSNWTIDQLGRTIFMLHLPHENPADFAGKLKLLFETADMNEQVALYASFPVLPYPELFVHQTTEGIRTNMTVVFDAIALNNPYPKEQLDEDSWNQMVLKAAFMDRPLYRIQGLGERTNQKLADIVSDYARERWAAGRVVNPELWRVVGNYLQDNLLEDIKKLLKDDHPLQREAGLLALSSSTKEEAQQLLANSETKPTMGWDELALAWWKDR